MVDSSIKPNIYFAHPLLHARDWQHRPEFDQVCNWWKDSGAGVCALVGIGGAGKTAITEHFLRVLPNVMPEHSEIPKDTSLKTPQNLFVFSFYDAPNPDNFFAELVAWLIDNPFDEAITQPSYSRTIHMLHKTKPCLLILDGLEKAQNESIRSGVFGQLVDKRLSNLLSRISFGYLPNVSAIITTRFPLADLDEKMPPHYLPVPIEEISLEFGIKLLRKRGVKGSDVELKRIVNECGRHALNVDLVGGYIADLGGDANLKLGTAEEIKQVREKESDPRRRRVIEQEFRFARIAERYCEVLSQKDPAALALLQRICLFRLGIDAEELASIFTGEEKEAISGSELARLTQDEFNNKLKLLADMHLLEASQIKTCDSSPKIQYTIHPAVRDGFLKNLDAETTKHGHEVIRKRLTTNLSGLPDTNNNPSNPRILDLLEEIIFHTLSAKHVQEAWDIYSKRIGAYKNLLWRLGAYERGERICRIFANGYPPKTALMPIGLSKNLQTTWITEWGLYLQKLGHLDDAARCYEKHNEIMILQKNWKNASKGNQNLAGILFLNGHLTSGLQISEEALRLADLANDDEAKRNSYAYRAHGLAQRGDIDSALVDFKNAVHHQSKFVSIFKKPLFSNLGLWQTILLTHLGHNIEAIKLIERNKFIINILFGNKSQDIPKCNLLLADIACKQRKLRNARHILEEAHEWAIAHDARAVLCWSALIHSHIALESSKREAKNDQERDRFLKEASSSVEEGLHIAQDCGYGIYHIDLMLIRAQISLHQGDADSAIQNIRIALDDGIHPKTESGLPVLLAANDPECGYAWGIAEGYHLRAEAYLLQAAQILGSKTYKSRSRTLPDKCEELIKEAHEQLNQCIEIRQRIQDCKLKETQKVLNLLNRRILTEYPVIKSNKTSIESGVLPMKANSKRFRVALSFPGEHRDVVSNVADCLAIELGKEKVFYDCYFEAELARPNLDTYLQNIYHNQSDLIIVFLCKEYEQKEWCGLEWRAIRDLLKKKESSLIMLMHFDDTPISGSFSIDGYVNLNNRQPEEIASLIIQRLKLNDQRNY